MAINYRKLKAQVGPFTDENGKKGFLFSVTEEQKARGLYCIFQAGVSKRSFLRTLLWFIQEEEELTRDYVIG
ncbi:MAG: hypothetical protein IJX16_00025 [Clostridia bacterium]|nr:hypothetical protein [Clostridia bacterium]